MFKKRHPPVGARPGTLMLPENAVTPRIRVIRFTEAQVHDDLVGNVDDLHEILTREGVIWIDVQGLGDEPMMRTLGDIFSMHPLALEDIVNVPQRPTTDVYDHHQLYISRMAQLTAAGAIDLEQVSVFIGRNYVLTVQERYGDVLDPVRRRINEGKGPIRRSGPDYLAYAIIDTIIDGFYPVLEHVSELLESLESEVIKNPTRTTLGHINRARNQLLDLRRGISPQRDAVGALVRVGSDFFTPDVQVYLRDCYDHCVQVVDVIESYREMTSGLLNTYLSSIGNRTNEVMKVLTIMASIFIPLTFMAGIYGMNLEGMPELGWTWFYPTLLVLMIAIAGGMLYYFYRKGWIGSGGGREDER